MHDTFTACAQPGYHPDCFARSGAETGDEHEVVHWLKCDKKLAVVADGKIRVHGNCSRIPWKRRYYHKPAAARTDVKGNRNVEPLLNLHCVKG